MPTQSQNAFNGGELSPLMLGRTDMPVYGSGLRRGRNAMVVPHGPAHRRPGTRRAGAARSSASFTASFVFGPGDAYTCELSDLKMRFWRSDRSQVLDGFLNIVELTTPWTAAQARELRWHQSADVMWFTHPSKPMQELRRTVLGPPETFTLAAADMIDGPYYAPNATATTFTASGTGTGSLGITASAVTGINNGTGFQTTDVGRHLRFGTAWGRITARASTTQVTVNFVTAIADASATTNWRLGLYSDTTGHPSCVCIHQERLTLGSNPTFSFPRVDLSKSGAFLTFTPGTDDDSAIQMVIGADAVPAIRDVRSERVLVVVTGSGALRVSTSDTSTALTPLNVDVAKLPTSTGGGNVRALSAQGSVLYLDPQRRSLGEIRARSEVYADALGYREISIRNEHLLRDSPGVSLAWADKPWGQVCIAREDGVLLLGAYAPEQDVVGFTPQVLAGGGLVLSVNTLPTLDGDEIWLLVDRDGSIGLEVVSNLLRNTEPDREAVNLDTAVTVRDARAATLTKISADAGAGTELWRASAGVFVAGDAAKAIGVLERGDDDELGMPTWSLCVLRIESVDSTTDVTVKVEGTAPQSPVASGDWLVSIDQVTGLSHMNGTSCHGLFDGFEAGPFTVSGDAVAVADVLGEIDVWVATVGRAYRTEMQPMPPHPETAKGDTTGRRMRAVRTRTGLVRTAGLRQRRHDGTDSGELPLRRRRQDANAAPPFYTGDLPLSGGPASNSPVGPLLVFEGAYPACITNLATEYAVGETG